MTSPPDNIVWHALTGAHAKFATGTAAARRYAPGFSPIAAFANRERPDLGALAPFSEPDEHLYCEGWTEPVPAGWQLHEEAVMFRMVWDGPIPVVDTDPAAIQLGPEHAVQALELATLTRPGPFGPRTIELGDYLGCFEGTRLLGMAGERFWAPPFREISGVCTHPDSQGRGLARRLMLQLIRRQLERAEVPFLHVLRENTRAHGLYARMGFRVHSESVVRVFSRC